MDVNDEDSAADETVVAELGDIDATATASASERAIPLENAEETPYNTLKSVVGDLAQQIDQYNAGCQQELLTNIFKVR